MASISRANILCPGVAKNSVDGMFQEADVIVDCSADVSAAWHLALDVPGGSRRLSLFLSPTGEQLVLLLEGKGRNVSLDTLEMQFYRLLLTTEALNDHYGATGNVIRYGRSCRDLSAVLSADAITLFAGIGSRAIERLLAEDEAVIQVWKRLISEYVRYDHDDRTPLALEKRTQTGRETAKDSGVGGRVIAMPKLGGPASSLRPGCLSFRFDQFATK